MRYFIAFFVILSLVSIIGCEGGGTGDASLPSDRTPGSETILAEGDATIAAGGESQALGTVDVTEKGLLVAVILWEGEPSQLTVTLKHTGSDLVAEATGVPPLAATIDVTNDAITAGTSWELSVTNPDGPDVTVSYKVAFLKQ